MRRQLSPYRYWYLLAKWQVVDERPLAPPPPTSRWIAEKNPNHTSYTNGDDIPLSIPHLVYIKNAELSQAAFCLCEIPIKRSMLCPQSILAATRRNNNFLLDQLGCRELWPPQQTCSRQYQSHHRWAHGYDAEKDSSIMDQDYIFWRGGGGSRKLIRIEIRLSWDTVQSAKIRF